MQADGAWEGSAVYIALNFYFKKKEIEWTKPSTLEENKNKPPKSRKRHYPRPCILSREDIAPKGVQIGSWGIKRMIEG